MPKPNGKKRNPTSGRSSESSPNGAEAVLYARVSSAEQLREGFSIPAQVELLRGYAEREGVTIAAEFTDDESGSNSKRPGFVAMLGFIRKHPHVRVVLAEKVDRLYRNFRDPVTLDDLGVTIHFVKDGMIYGAGSPARDQLNHDIRLALAKNYLANLSEEVKKGMRQKCREGGWPTWSPLGYLNVKDSAEKRRTGGIVPDPEKAPLVRDLFEAAATGDYSLGDLQKIADGSGLRGRYGAVLSKSAVQYVLTNEAYLGRFSWGGVTYEGKYEPLIERDLYDRVQRALAGGTKAKTRTHFFTFAGMIRCGICDGLMTGDRKKGKYVYYACRGGSDCKRYYPESLFDAKVVDALRSLAVDRAVSEWIIAELARWYDTVAARENDAAARHHRRLTEIRHLEAQSYEDKLLGRLTEETWRTLNAKWRAEADELQRVIEKLAPAVSRERFLDAARRPFELTELAADQYVAQKAEERARLLRLVCSNFRVDDGNVRIEMRSPFDVMFNMHDRQDWLARVDDYRTAILAVA